jgi:hypothetical protein
MRLLNILFDKIDEIRWDLTYKIENIIERLKCPCTKNPETCKRINCNCPFVGEIVEEIEVKPKKNKRKNSKKKINNRKKDIIDSMGMCD